MEVSTTIAIKHTRAFNILSKARGDILSIMTKPTHSIILRNNLFVICLINLIQDLQIISLLFSPGFMEESRPKPMKTAETFFLIINPFLIVQRENEAEYNYYLMALLWIILIIFLVLSHSGYYSKPQSKDKLKDNQVTLFFLFLFTEILLFPIADFLIASFQVCFLNVNCSFKFSVFELFTIPAVISIGYYLKRLNFERRIAFTPLGSKKSNLTKSNSFLIHCFMVTLFKVSSDTPFIACSFISLGFFTTFWIKVNSEDYICPRIKRSELAANALALWFSISLTAYTLIGSAISKLFLIFLVTGLLLILALFFKPLQFSAQLFQADINHLRYPRKCTTKLETLTYLYSNREQISEYEKMIFIGFMDKIVSYSNFRQDNKMTFGNKSTDQINLDDTQTKGTLIIDLKNHLEETDLKDQEQECFIQHISQEYVSAFAKFPMDNDLRISFLYFLADFLHTRKTALYHVSCLKEDNTLSFENQLSLLRIERILSSDHFSKINKSKNPGFELQPEFASEIKILRINSKMSELLERATVEYIYLWQTLKQDNPKITKVYGGLQQSIKVIKECEDFWKKTKTLQNLNIKAKKNYGIFLKNILKRKERGDKIIEEYYENLVKHRRDLNKLLKINFRQEVGSNPNPLCVISQNYEGSLIIHNCNNQFSRVLGYSKTFLNQKHLRLIILSKSKYFYEKMLTRLSFSGEEKTEKNQLISFMTKSKFLKMFYADIKIVNENSKTSYILLKLNSQQSFRSEAHLLVNKKGIVQSFNASSLGLFGKKMYKHIGKGPFPLKSLSQQLEQFFDKDKFMEEEERKQIIKEEFYLKESSKSKGEISNLIIQKVSDSSLYLYKIWNEYKKDHSTADKTKVRLNKTEDGLLSTLISYRKMNTKLEFEFYIDNNLDIRGDLVNSQDRELVKLNIDKLRKDSLTSKRETKEKSLKIDFGQGIRTRRLMDGVIREVNESEGDCDSELDEYSKIQAEKSGFNSILNRNSKLLGLKSSFYNNHHSNLIKNTIQNSCSTKKQFEKIIHPKRIAFIYKISIFFSILFACLHQTAFTVASNYQGGYFSTLRSLIQVGMEINPRNSALMKVYQRMFDIALINDGVDLGLNMEVPIDLTVMKKVSKKYIKIDLNEFITLQKKIELGLVHLNDHPVLQQKLTEKNNQIIYKGVKTNYSYSEATKQMEGHLLVVLGKDINDITFSDQNVDFLVKNLFETMIQRTDVIFSYLSQIGNFLVQDQQSFYVMVYWCILIEGFSLALIFSIFIHRLSIRKQNAVDAFYGFQETYIQEILDMCDLFLQMIQNYMITDYTESNGERDLQELSNVGQGHKKSKKTEVFLVTLKKRKRKGTLAPKISLPTCIISLYYLCNMLLLLFTFKNQKEIVIDLTKTGDSLIETGRSFSSIDFQLIILQLCMWDKWIIISNVPNFYVLDYAMNHSSTSINSVDQEFIKFAKKNQKFNDAYKDLALGDVCLNYLKVKNLIPGERKVDCREFWNGRLNHNMIAALTYSINELKTLHEQTKVMSFKSFETFPFEGECPSSLIQTSLVVTDPTILVQPPIFLPVANRCLLVSKQLFNIKDFVRQFANPVLLRINKIALETLIEDCDSSTAETRYLTYAINCGLIISELCIICFILYFHKQSKQIENMMKYHDLKEIKNNPRLIAYLSELKAQN